MKHCDYQAWVTALGRAAREFLLACHPDLADRDDYRLRAEPCPVHGPGCARVAYGMLRDHLQWARADPVKVSEAMLRTMLPAGVRPAGCPCAAGNGLTYPGADSPQELPAPAALVASAYTRIGRAQWAAGAGPSAEGRPVAGAALLPRPEPPRAPGKGAADPALTPEDRDAIERAKGVVTLRLGVNEAEALRRLRRASGNGGGLAEVARRLLAAEAVFAALEGGPGGG